MGQSLSALQVLRTSENEDEVVQAIVADQNIDVSTPDDEGRTALHWAAAEGNHPLSFDFQQHTHLC
jgi:ankyrin repeat protein